MNYKKELEEFDKELEEFDKEQRELEEFDKELKRIVKGKPKKEFRGRSKQCNTKAEVRGTNQQRNTNVDRNEDGSVQNPTIQREAQELTEKYGKKTIRTITGTFWCDSEEKRHNEFERVRSVWPTSRYILYGPLETTEENKKPHLHFVISFSTTKMFKTIIKTLRSSEYHIENCRNYHAAVEYCLKSNPNDKLEYGEPLKQGLRTDIKKTLEESHYNIKEIQENKPELYVRYRSGIEKMCETKNKENNVMDWLNLTSDEEGNIKKKEYKPTKVYWYFGPTGTGKSRKVKELVSEKVINKIIKPDEITIINCFTSSGFAIGMINYNSKILILDEFRGDYLKFSELLKIIDGTTVNVKGSEIYLHLDEIYVTSCYNPYTIYKNLGKTDSIKQLLRRITECKQFNNDGIVNFPCTYDDNKIGLFDD